MLRLHLTAFVAVNTLLTLFNLMQGPPWWAVWPLMGWGVLLLVHILSHRAGMIDDAWAEQRALDIRAKSYDNNHIEEIRRSANFSVDKPS